MYEPCGNCSWDCKIPIVDKRFDSRFMRYYVFEIPAVFPVWSPNITDPTIKMYLIKEC